MSDTRCRRWMAPVEEGTSTKRDIVLQIVGILMILAVITALALR